MKKNKKDTFSKKGKSTKTNWRRWTVRKVRREKIKCEKGI
jgi:hypothetical protein